MPALTPLLVAAIAAPFIGSVSTFVTLTAAGLAMGMMMFIMASGLTLAFGMMDVLNFGHGAFISLGAYVATLVCCRSARWAQADSLALNLALLALALAAAVARLRRARLRLRAAGDRAGLRPASRSRS